MQRLVVRMGNTMNRWGSSPEATQSAFYELSAVLTSGETYNFKEHLANKVRVCHFLLCGKTVKSSDSATIGLRKQVWLIVCLVLLVDWQGRVSRCIPYALHTPMEHKTARGNMHAVAATEQTILYSAMVCHHSLFGIRNAEWILSRVCKLAKPFMHVACMHAYTCFLTLQVVWWSQRFLLSFVLFYSFGFGIRP